MKRHYRISFLFFLLIFSLFYVRDKKSAEYLHGFKIFPYVQENSLLFPLPFWVDLNIKDSLGYSFLHYSIEKGNLAETKMLLKRGARTNIQNNARQSPLHLAAFYGQKYTIQLLVQAGANLNIRDKYEKTPIFYATERGAFDSVKVFTRLGASLLCLDSLKEDILDKAILHGYRDIVLYLLGKMPRRSLGQDLKTIVFLNSWKALNNRLFNIHPIFDEGALEFFLARIHILSFTRGESQSILFFLFSREHKRNPQAIFRWLPDPNLVS